MPYFSLLKDTSSRNHSLTNDKSRVLVYWMETSTEKEGNIAELTKVTLTTPEQFYTNQILENSYSIVYPSQKKQIVLRIGFSRASYPVNFRDTISKMGRENIEFLIEYLREQKIQLLDYFNICDSLSVNGWTESNASVLFSEIYPQKELRIIKINTTMPSHIPHKIHLDEISDRWFENYDEQIVHAIISDTIVASNISIPLEWSIYINHFSPKEME